MWDLPGSGIEPLSPASAGGFSITAKSAGKPRRLFLTLCLILDVSSHSGENIGNSKAFLKELIWKKILFFCQALSNRSSKVMRFFCEIFWEAPCWQCPLRDLHHFNLPTMKPLLTSVSYSLIPHPLTSSLLSSPDALASGAFWWRHLMWL